MTAAEDRKPILIVVAGANGSGKTTLTSQLLQDRWLRGVTYLNPDAIAQERFGGWNDAKAVLQAAQYVADERERALAARESIAFETVFSAQDKLDYVRRAKQAGFFVRIFYVCTVSPEINAARVARRVMEGGHDVPITKIITRFQRSLANAASAALVADRFYLWDNSVEGQSPRRILRAVGGRIAREYEPPPHPMAALVRDALLVGRDALLKGKPPSPAPR
jgi:predicted ABC-type ATPase